METVRLARRYTSRRVARSKPSGEEQTEGSPLRDEIDSLGRARARAEREADAARRLDELKRRMGK